MNGANAEGTVTERLSTIFVRWMDSLSLPRAGPSYLARMYDAVQWPTDGQSSHRPTRRRVAALGRELSYGLLHRRPEDHRPQQRVRGASPDGSAADSSQPA